MSASSKRPWMVPSSPEVPWRTGETTSTPIAAGVAWARVRSAEAEPDAVRLGVADSPARRAVAAVSRSQWPDLAMPMGTTSYLRLSMALRMEPAERSETSCSPERPPKRMPMRSFFFMTFPVSDSGLWFVRVGVEKNHGGYRFLLLGRGYPPSPYYPP